MPTLNFTVDAALLLELGERLVSKPHIALAELVKNGYDADASEVVIDFRPDEDCIEVCDDGHGMTFEEFRDFWMRVGTRHKEQKRESRNLRRPMTGSKGVGRLAVQFLSRQVTIQTVAQGTEGSWLEASVEWGKAVRVGDELTDVTVEYAKQPGTPPFEHGTSIALRGLKQSWGKKEVEGLAAELWWLQPPFRSPAGRPSNKSDFRVRFISSQPEFERVFDAQMDAIMRIWNARLVGRNDMGHVTLSLEFSGKSPKTFTYSIAGFEHNGGRFDAQDNLNDGDFEIRIFNLAYRQPHGIRVEDAREYFRKYGGVHVYDGGFRLPYYGAAENDWLRITLDHARRISVSELLPKFLWAPRGMTFLPTLTRIFGVVNVNTSRERGLEIMITRDRLKESTAYTDLQQMVRYALDLYAQEEAQRQYVAQSIESAIAPASRGLEHVEQTLELYQREIPAPVYQNLSKSVREATAAMISQERNVRQQVGLLGALATAGISALAYQHELRKQFASIEDLIEEMRGARASTPSVGPVLETLSEDLSAWLERARATNALFTYLAEAENTQTRQRFLARAVLDEVVRQTRFLARGIPIDLANVDERLLLPSATLVEWGAIFQNVFTNSFNAMLDSERRLLQVSSRIKGKSREIIVQDTGQGVDLKTADELFEPFVRRLEISPARRALGYGGMGLGLTIVRLVADSIGCKVGFVEPGDGFSTAFMIGWRETE